MGTGCVILLIAHAVFSRVCHWYDSPAPTPAKKEQRQKGKG